MRTVATLYIRTHATYTNKTHICMRTCIHVHSYIHTRTKFFAEENLFHQWPLPSSSGSCYRHFIRFARFCVTRQNTYRQVKPLMNRV